VIFLSTPAFRFPDFLLFKRAVQPLDFLRPSGRGKSNKREGCESLSFGSSHHPSGGEAIRAGPYLLPLAISGSRIDCSLSSTLVSNRVSPLIILLALPLTEKPTAKWNRKWRNFLSKFLCRTLQPQDAPR
jgi:hypothetical protein